MKRILLVDMQSFLWSYISIRNHLHKYESVIFLYSKDQFRTIKSLSQLIKKIAVIHSIKNVHFVRVEGSSKSLSIYQQMFNITNDISDTYNPNEDIFHLMCRQFPQKPICETLEDNGFYYTSIKANPIYLNFDNENEAKEFLKNSHEYNSRFIAVKDSDASFYDPNEIIRKEDETKEDLIDIEMLSLSVIDFMRVDLKYFSSKVDEEDLPKVKVELYDI